MAVADLVSLRRCTQIPGAVLPAFQPWNAALSSVHETTVALERAGLGAGRRSSLVFWRAEPWLDKDHGGPHRKGSRHRIGRPLPGKAFRARRRFFGRRLPGGGTARQHFLFLPQTHLIGCE